MMQDLRRFFGRLFGVQSAPEAPPKVTGSALEHLFPGYVEADAPAAREADLAPLTHAPAAYDPRDAIAQSIGEREAAAPATAAPAPIDPLVLSELADLAASAVLTHAPGFRAGQILRLPMAGIAAPARPRPLVAGTEGFTVEWLADWHRREEWPAFDLACSFATDAVVAGLGYVWLDGKLVVSREVMPDYVYDLVLGLPAQPQNVLRFNDLPLRTIERPCVVIHGGMNVYGHFLIEVLFGVMMVRHAMAGSGLNHAYLMPVSASSWLVDILCDQLGVPREDIEFFDPETERVHLRQVILPSLMNRGVGFHPAGNALIDAMFGAVRDTLGPLPPAPFEARRLFLARNSLPGQHSARECLNEAELVAIATERHGFVAVAMEAYSWREQLALLEQAEIVLGAFGSGLHAAILCKSTLRVACLGLGNLVQSQIAALRGQEIGYLTEGFTIGDRFSVAEDMFAAFLDAVVSAPAQAVPDTP